MSAWIWSGVLASILLVMPDQAMAYRQTKTCLTLAERDDDAPTNLPTCITGQIGWPVRWPTREVSYKVNRKGFDGILPAVDGEIHPDVLSAVRQSLRQWGEPDCSDFVFRYEGLTDVDRHSPEDGVNVITWVNDRWAESSSTIALSSTTMTQKGVLVDADVEFNVRAHRFTISSPVGAGNMDLANTMTHEAGHMLGLDEAPNKESTMYYNASTGEDKKRDLQPDDISGVCTIYPQGVPPVQYGSEYDSGMNSCPGGEDCTGDGGCCSTVTTPLGDTRSRALMAMMVFGLVGVWRRRRDARDEAKRCGKQS